LFGVSSIEVDVIPKDLVQAHNSRARFRLALINYSTSTRIYQIYSSLLRSLIPRVLFLVLSVSIISFFFPAPLSVLRGGPSSICNNESYRLRLRSSSPRSFGSFLSPPLSSL